MQKRPVGLLGLGLMGTVLADRFMAAGYDVLGYDVDATRCKALAESGGRPGRDHVEVAAESDQIVLSLPDSKVVEEVVTQIDGQLGPGKIILDTTTGDPATVAALGARLAARGVGYLDATISGSSAQTAQGDVIVIAGGPGEVFDACGDLLACFARQSFHVGDCGTGTKMKLLSNLVLGLNRAALAEALALAAAMGLEAETTLSILTESAAYSRVMETKGQKMITGDFTPQAKLSQHLKDVRLILSEGARAGAELPLSTVHRKLLEDLEAAGLGQLDNSAVIRAFGDGRRVERPGDDTS